jgi:serine/threonine protein kinase
MNQLRYHILGEVGQGQFGKVFCGCDRTTGQLFALKRLDHHRFPTHSFLKELAILVRLNHLNIVSFHGIEYRHSGRYIVMDYCQGGTLRQLLESKTELPLVQKLRLVQGTLQGLEHIHQHRIIHCDLKPENILLDVANRDWIAKIADFGIARFLGPPGTHEQPGEMGSPAYMAPERFYGHFSVESDLYAVGVLLYELLSGHRPFSGMPLEVMKAHLNQPLRIPSPIPTLLKVIIRKALKKLPQHRYRSALEMKLMLETVITSLQHPRPTSVSLPLAASVQQTASQCSHTSRVSTDSQRCIRALAIDPPSLQPYMAFSQVIDRLWWRPSQGCMFTTQTVQERLLWLKTPEEVQLLATFPIPQAQSQQRPCADIDVEPQGRWIAMLGSDRTISDSGGGDGDRHSQTNPNLSICQLFPFSDAKSATLEPTAEKVWITSNRHLLVAHQPLMQPEDPDIPYQRLQLWNRRAQMYWTYDLKGIIKTVAITPSNPGQLFAITEAKEPTGLFISLSPLKIKRVSLSIDAQWVCATHWGYLVGDRSGNIACLNRRGKTVAQGKLPLGVGQAVSAMTFLKPTTLIIALQQQEQAATVVTLDLSLHLPKSLLTL